MHVHQDFCGINQRIISQLLSMVLGERAPSARNTHIGKHLCDGGPWCTTLVGEPRIDVLTQRDSALSWVKVGGVPKGKPVRKGRNYLAPAHHGPKWLPGGPSSVSSVGRQAPTHIPTVNQAQRGAQHRPYRAQQTWWCLQPANYLNIKKSNFTDKSKVRYCSFLNVLIHALNLALNALLKHVMKLALSNAYSKPDSLRH